MDILSQYSGGIEDNLRTKQGFLNNSAPDLSGIIRSDVSLVKTAFRKKRSLPDQSPSWFRVRPVRRVSYKYSSDGSDSDEDYSPSPRHHVRYKTNAETELDVEELDNVERRLGLNKRPNQYGSVEGVVVGQWWKTRMECSYSGAHRPPVSGIHAGPDGAYSVALSGGYEGDIDAGYEFTYTGEGGRDLRGTKANPKNLRTAPQSKDQTLTRGNLALHMNFENHFPVRVVRGYKLHGDYAPEDGYRYDGLYQVVKCWSCIGSTGFLIYKFHFVRCQDQLPLIDSMDTMLLFSSIKEELSRREELKRGQSDSANNESCEEDEEDLRYLPSEEVKEESRIFYIEDGDTIDMFYKGKFLGWSKAESYEESAKKFRNLVCGLENAVTGVNFPDDVVCSNVEEMELDGCFLGWDTSKESDIYVKKFKNVIDGLEDSISEEAGMKDVDDDEDFSHDLSSCESSTPTTDSSCRRKPNIPRKVVRFSLEKTSCYNYPLAG